MSIHCVGVDGLCRGTACRTPTGPLSRERSEAKLDLSSPVESSDSRLERRIGLQKPENLLLVSVVKAEGRAALPRNRLDRLEEPGGAGGAGLLA